MITMVDIHSHILPMVDDGARSWEMAVEMVQMAQRDGVTHMVATPHANFEYDYNRESHAALLAELQAKAGNGIELILGCDFHLSHGNVDDAMVHPEHYTIGNTRYLLVELADLFTPHHIPNLISSLMSKGLIPILTHPERNPTLQRSPERVADWAQMGVLVQITASAYTGKWGKPIQKLAHWYAEQGLVHVLASDAHSPNSRRPGLSEARKAFGKSFGEAFATAVTVTNPLAIVQNQPLPDR
jgi:protein-tyrosine phosphatase